MSVTIVSKEPALVYAGETIEWYRSFSDYPATEYTLKYYLAGPASITLTAAAYNTTDHKVTVTAATSATWTYGIYSWVAYAEKGTGATLEKYRLCSGFLTVKTAAGKTHAKKMLDAIETFMEGQTISDASEYTIAGRSITKMSREELIKWRNYYRQEYLSEVENERALEGKDTGSLIRFRFRTP